MARPDAELIDLETAWTWICPSCKARNYHHGHQIKDKKMLAEARLMLGDGELVLQPDTVYCIKCENEYGVAEYEEIDEEEDE